MYWVSSYSWWWFLQIREKYIINGNNKLHVNHKNDSNKFHFYLKSNKIFQKFAIAQKKKNPVFSEDGCY